MADEPRTRIGRYEITAPLDAGGMGQVFRAWDPSLRREVAIKLLRDEVAEDPARRQRLLEEARAAGSLNHPNIMAVYDVGVDQDVAFIVTELIDGAKLRQELERGILSTKRLLDLVTQIASGLRAAHEAGIAHRDLKPDNVMVTRDGRVKIVDFGLAKTYVSAPDGSHRADAPTVTLPGTVVGTVAYMSPEQALGAALDLRTDQFSFGVMLYEMATGRHPFRRDSSPQTMTAIIEDEPRAIGELNAKVPVPLRWVIERCLAKDPADRYASTADLFKDLATLQTRLGEMTGEEAPQAGRRRSRPSGLTIGAALGGLAIGAAALSLAPRESSPSLLYRPLVTDRAFQGAPAWSPDGSTLAYVSTVDGVFQVFTRGLTTSQTSSALTNSSFDSSDPFWSPDGARVFYHSLAEEWESLWVVGAAGGTPSLAISNALGGTISPDGSTIAFFRESATGQALFGLQRSLWMASPDGTNARAYALAPFKDQTFVDGALRFSPDGRHLLAWVWGWTSDASNVPSSEFWVVPWPTGNPRRVLSSLTRAAPAAASFDWLPDSQRIVVSLWDEVTATTHLWIANVNTGESRQLTSTPGSESRPALSPDGRRLAFTDEAIDFDVVEIPLDGGQPRPLLATSRSEFDPTFAGDGSEYLYVSDKGGTLQIWRSSRDGRFVEPVVGPSQFPGDRTLALGSPALSPDGERVAYQRYTEKGGYQVWVSSIRGSGTPVLLAPGSFYQDAPTWSPDGQSVALVQRTRDLVASLAVVRLGSGSAPRVLVPEGVTLSARPKWSPDGRWILCDTAEGLVIVSAESAVPRVISEDLWIAMTWAADSRRVLGLREADDRPRHFALAALDIETGREEMLNPDLGIIPPAFQPIRGLALLGENALVTSVASARSDIYVVEDFEAQPSLVNRLFFWR
jgi:serine/threonine protein kinase